MSATPDDGGERREPPGARPLYLSVGEERVFALFHAPGPAARETAVLLCPPFGWEDIGSYRSRRDWAEHLARAGHPTLRLDLPGSGDSAGSASDPLRLEAWTQAVSGAERWLRRTSGARRVAAIGIGLGGIVALRAVLEDAAIEELVLWSVPARGRTLVRELRAFSRLEVAHVLEAGETQPTPQPDAEGELVANGYRLSGETVAALEGLDLSELPQPAAAPRRALLLERDGLKVDERLRALLERAGTSVTVANGRGYGAMTREPQDARAPSEVFGLVSSWLAEGEAQEEASATDPPRASFEEPGGRQVPADHETLELLASGVELRETPVFIDNRAGRLFGVLTEPLGPHRELCALLLNAGPQRHTGPNRMWVEIARRWAARGVPTLRIDLAGIGDSDGDAAALVRVASLYVPGYVQQARSALDMLADRGLPARFVLLGLCSGAYWSMHAALQDERVAAVMLLNPRALIWDPWGHTVQRTRDLRARLLLGSTWRRVLRGEITLARHLETAHALAARAVNTPLRARERIAASRRRDGAGADPLEGLLDALRDRDQRALLLLTGKEPLREEMTASGLLGRLDRWPNLKLAILGSTADTHTLSPLWLQRQVHELVDGALEDELRRS
jgi:alpha-beta hydrolase superfamily lysophospholipase